MIGQQRGGWPDAARVARSAAALVAALVGLGAASPAAAQSLSIDAVTARAIAHAGAGFVADDASAVWTQNPAGAARRAATRVVLGVSSIDTDLEIQPATDEPAPIAVSRAGTGIAPQATLTTSWGRTTLGVSVLSGQRLGRRFEAPPAGLSEPTAARLYSLRYAGLAGALRREGVTAGVARRLGDVVALGASFGVSRVALRENRRVWAGLDGLDNLANPVDDLELAFTAAAPLVPSASVSAVVVPEGFPVELAVGAMVVGRAHLTGELRGVAADASGPLVRGAATASLDLPETLALRAGLRWQGARWSVEGDGQLELVPARGRALRWQIDDLTVEHRSGVQATVTSLPAQLSLRSLATVRAAVDVEVVEGWLWLIAGAGWSPRSTSAERATPGFAELGGLSLSTGAEVSAGGVTVTLGLLRTWAPALKVADSLRRLDNPFAEGDAVTGLGRYRAATDMVGISVEIEQP